MTTDDLTLPLAGIRVLDFAQFLAGPAAALRLADLGADVVKIERPDGGDLCRSLAVANAYVGGDSLLFHTFNRNKRSVAADLKDAADLATVKKLIGAADVLIHNFRPGVMARLGLDYDAVAALNPRLVYASVSGYGDEGPLRDKPGQDLLVQALSGMAWLSGDRDAPPMPVGLPVLDMAAGAALAQGVLAALVRRGATGGGGRVEVDLLSVAIDLQYEPLTVFLNHPDTAPARSGESNANVYGAAPYGLYAAADGHIALAMTPLARLADLLELPALARFAQSDAYSKRDEIKRIIADCVARRTTAEWLTVLQEAGVWCSAVYDWRRLVAAPFFRAVDMTQETRSGAGAATRATCCPIRIDGRRLKSATPAPALGAHTAEVVAEFGAASAAGE